LKGYDGSLSQDRYPEGYDEEGRPHKVRQGFADLEESRFFPGEASAWRPEEGDGHEEEEGSVQDRFSYETKRQGHFEAEGYEEAPREEASCEEASYEEASYEEERSRPEGRDTRQTC